MNTKLTVKAQNGKTLRCVLSNDANLEDQLEKILRADGGGQKLIEDTVAKIGEVDAICREKGIFMEIQADGGIGVANAGKLIAQGLTVAVAGSAVFKSEDVKGAVEGIRNA